MGDIESIVSGLYLTGSLSVGLFAGYNLSEYVNCIDVLYKHPNITIDAYRDMRREQIGNNLQFNITSLGRELAYYYLHRL